jgi:hypothetical protein
MIDIILAQKLAYERNLELSEYARDIIEDILANDGHCPAKPDSQDTICPCYGLLVYNKCIYDLFIKEDY